MPTVRCRPDNGASEKHTPAFVFQCIRPEAMIPIRDAVHGDIAQSRDVYEWVAALCRRLGAETEDLVPFDKYAQAAASLGRPSSAARALFGSNRYLLDEILPRFGVKVTLVEVVMAEADKTLQEVVVAQEPQVVTLETQTIMAVLAVLVYQEQLLQEVLFLVVVVVGLYYVLSRIMLGVLLMVDLVAVLEEDIIHREVHQQIQLLAVLQKVQLLRLAVEELLGPLMQHLLLLEVLVEIIKVEGVVEDQSAYPELTVVLEAELVVVEVVVVDMVPALVVLAEPVAMVMLLFIHGKGDLIWHMQ